MNSLNDYVTVVVRCRSYRDWRVKVLEPYFSWHAAEGFIAEVDQIMLIQKMGSAVPVDFDGKA